MRRGGEAEAEGGRRGQGAIPAEEDRSLWQCWVFAGTAWPLGACGWLLAGGHFGAIVLMGWAVHRNHHA